MSQPPDDAEESELQALQRKLDAAFETTRPRRGFEDELWLRVQASRPPQRRLRDALAALFQGIREVPAVPLAAVAAVLVVVLGVGIFAYSGLGHGGGGGGATALSGGQNAPRNSTAFAGTFGRLPTPVFGTGSKTPAPQGADAAAGAYLGPAQYTWAGTLDISITSAPVFRYYEPSTVLADQFASALGAVLRDRPAGFLGSYSASDYTLKIQGTVKSPPSSPAFFIVSSPSMPAIEAAGASPEDLANIFLAQHTLSPVWNYTMAVESSGDPIKVTYQRQFEAPGYGAAYLVDSNGRRYGLEVDLSANRPVFVTGLLPVAHDIASYRIISPSDAIQSAIASGGTGTAAAPAPTVKLTQAELVYVVVPAGDHSYYEPAYLFSGTAQINGTTLTKRVLVPAVDPSQRKP